MPLRVDSWNENVRFRIFAKISRNFFSLFSKKAYEINESFRENFRENENFREKWRGQQKCREISEFQEANEV
jgi:hypothetical protein